LPDFNKNFKFLDGVFLNTQIQNFMKIGRVGTELYADGRTDMTKAAAASRNFADARKSGKHGRGFRTNSG
jgi:hypothetical protein